MLCDFTKDGKIEHCFKPERQTIISLLCRVPNFCVIKHSHYGLAAYYELQRIDHSSWINNGCNNPRTNRRYKYLLKPLSRTRTSKNWRIIERRYIAACKALGKLSRI